VNNLVSKEGIEFRVYIKSSSFPLFKALTKGQEIDKVRIAMERDKVDRIAFESAVKIGGVVKPSPLFNSTGKVLDKIEFSMLNDGALIPRSGFKIQQNLPYHESQTINHG